MADIQCPYCGLVSRIPDGMPANCVQCGRQLMTGAAVQYQYAQQPAPQMQQSFAAQPQMPVQQPAYPPEVLKHAKKKRRDWHILNAVLFGIQTFTLGFGVFLNDIGNDMFLPILGGWILSLPLFAFLSARLRPDGAYLEKKPFCRSRVTLGFLQFLIGGASFFTAAVIYAILEVLLK